MFTKDHVQRLIADIGNVKAEREDDHDAAVVERDVPARYPGNRDLATHQLPGAKVETPYGVDLSTLEIGEPYMFGLALDVFDPISGEVFAVTRPHRMGVAEPELFLTPRQLASEVMSARQARLYSDRAAGLINPNDAEQIAAADRAKAARDAAVEDEHRKAEEPALV
jgi:hypothetical protein